VLGECLGQADHLEPRYGSSEADDGDAVGEREPVVAIRDRESSGGQELRSTVTTQRDSDQVITRVD
jgi:hypothetical protein